VRSQRLLVRSALVLVLAGTLAACGDDGDDASDRGASTQTTVASAQPVVAEMIGADGAAAGRVTFVESGGRVQVEANLTNLPPGFHGFHVHAVGQCERGTPAFASAGGHMVLGEQTHPVHAGDQPVVLVMSDRSASLRFSTDRYRMLDLMNAEGRAVIVHANPDNYGNVPTRYVRDTDATTKATGDAGDRIACGVVGGGPVTTAAPSNGNVTTTTSAAGATTTTSAAGATTTTTRVTGATTTTARATGATLNCQTIAFTPNSEDAASSVTATGLPCSEAEAFVRVAGRQTSSGGPAEVTVQGYRCVRTRTVTDPLPQAFYECTSGTKKVTFVRS
jgi:Cu-Zn family superoxide dismutase